MYIEKVNSPADVKKLSVSEMNGLGVWGTERNVY